MMENNAELNKIEKINSKKDFDNIIKDASSPVFVKFTASWCGPCKMMIPVIEKVASELTKVKFIEVDVDDSDGLSDEYFISSVPTMMIFKNGSKVDEISGALPYDQLKSFIEQYSRYI